MGPEILTDATYRCHFCLCCIISQVFDHPSVAAITSYISSLGMMQPAAAADGSDSDEDDEPQGVAASNTISPSGASGPVKLARAPALGADLQQAALVGISALACRTAAGNAVMQLPGVDASRRVPFERWELGQQEQVSGWVAVGGAGW